MPQKKQRLRLTQTQVVESIGYVGDIVIGGGCNLLSGIERMTADRIDTLYIALAKNALLSALEL
jgi:hypothetical protein